MVVVIYSSLDAKGVSFVVLRVLGAGRDHGLQRPGIFIERPAAFGRLLHLRCFD
jgi:hypothetical protein